MVPARHGVHRIGRDVPEPQPLGEAAPVYAQRAAGQRAAAERAARGAAGLLLEAGHVVAQGPYVTGNENE